MPNPEFTYPDGSYDLLAFQKAYHEPETFTDQTLQTEEDKKIRFMRFHLSGEERLILWGNLDGIDHDEMYGLLKERAGGQAFAVDDAGYVELLGARRGRDGVLAEFNEIDFVDKSKLLVDFRKLLKPLGTQEGDAARDRTFAFANEIIQKVPLDAGSRRKLRIADPRRSRRG